MEKTNEHLPISQNRLMQDVLPLIEQRGRRYRKCRRVFARHAETGEKVVTRTSDGKETVNVAQDNCMVVRNETGAREQYIVEGEIFANRYKRVQAQGDEWALYEPLGEILGLTVTPDLTDSLGVGDDFAIVASWGEEQRARQGDILASPLPGKNEVYRIALREFEETYEPVRA